MIHCEDVRLVDGTFTSAAQISLSANRIKGLTLSCFGVATIHDRVFPNMGSLKLFFSFETLDLKGMAQFMNLYKKIQL